MMLLFFLLKMARYTFFIGFPAIQRWLWYLFYVPMLVIPYLFLLTVLSLEEERTGWDYRQVNFLQVPLSLLLIGILTNDIHQQAFRFPTAAMDSEGAYSRGILYLLAVLWIGALLILSIVIMMHCCSLSQCRRKLGVPLLALFWGLFYMLGYVFLGEIRIFGIVWLRLPEAFCFMIIFLWEGCLQIGLLRSNTGYELMFELMGKGVQIIDCERICRYHSQKAAELSGEQYLAAEEHAIMLREHTRLQSRPIRGGRVYWEDDLSEMHRIHNQLVEVNQQLENENALVSMQNEWLKKKSALEKKNQLYDAMAKKLSPWLLRMETLLNPRLEEKLFYSRIPEAAVYGAYVKRRGNLYLLAGEHSVLMLEELYLSIAESLEYLRLSGVRCEVFYREGGIERERCCPAEMILGLYDEFEQHLERALPGLTGVLVRLSYEGKAKIRMELAPTGEVKDVDL